MPFAEDIMNNSPSWVTRTSVAIRHTIRKLAEYQWFLISGGFLLVILFGFIGFWLAYQSRAEIPFYSSICSIIPCNCLPSSRVHRSRSIHFS